MHSESEPRYEIRAVSRLTGVTPVTLRAWERRYGAVTTMRSGSGSRRLYTQEDVQRLSLIKSLVDLGHPVSHVASLSTDELNRRLEQDMMVRAQRPQVGQSPVRVGAFGPRVAAALNAGPSQRGLDLVTVHTERDACRRLPAGTEIDTLVVEYTGVHEDTRDEVLALMGEACASRALVVYDFGNIASVASLRAPPLGAMRGPVEADELARACIAVSAPVRDARRPDVLPEVSGDIPRRAFSQARLNRLRETATAIGCECPHHLATLVDQLYAFEDYSVQCESRNADDARLHAYLHESTARSRVIIEEALESLVRFEGLED